MQFTQVSLVLLLLSGVLHGSLTTKRRRLIPSKSASITPEITHLLVFSASSETVVPFDPKSGWLLNDERKIHLFLSGSGLENSSLLFTASPDDCSSANSISPVYRLSSAPVVEVHVNLKRVSNARSPMFLCLLPSTVGTANSTALKGPYFMFLREKSTIPFAVKICLILMLFVVSGFFSGLNLGLMSLSVNDLNLVAESEDSTLRQHAKRVLPLRRRGNYLLCSIVLANVLVNSLGTVLLDSLVHGLLAVIGATAMIVLMGEIIPQAICSRYGLVIGARTHLITWTCMIVTGVISYPLGFILDKILGQEVTASYTRDQIVGMLTRVTADIEKPELDVITGVLSLRKKTVKDAMTLLPDVYMLDQDRKTDAELLLDVHKHGYSRIPVYANERTNVIGIVKLRDFALITPEQYHLTVKNLLEFHTHPYGYTKASNPLYDLMQDFLKARWHIALVQEPSREQEESADTVYTIAGVITLEDVIEEMLQREIIEEADFLTDNRHKIRRKRAKTTDYTTLVKRPSPGPSISPQLKIAVFQFLSTHVPQFSSGFISPEILQTLLSYNIYATVKRQANQSSNAIYLYKQGFRYELFTLVTQGNATLESGAERIMSTVGPFSFFAASALLAENKTVKDVHELFDQLFTKNDRKNLLDRASSSFVPDYNLIVNSELHVLQIHRFIWLAAVRATQRQRSADRQERRMQPEQLFANALEEIASITHVPIDKNNLTNFQRVFVNEKDASRAGPAQNTSVFDAIHSMDTNVQPTVQRSDSQGGPSSTGVDNVVISNPILLTIPEQETTNANASVHGSAHGSNESTSLGDGTSNSSIHITQMFDESTNVDDHEREKEHLIAQGPSINDTRQRRTNSVSLSPIVRFHAGSDSNLTGDPDSPNRTDDLDRPRRARSMLGGTNCVPS